MKMKLGSMTFGEILDRGIKMLFAQLPTFLVLGLVLLSPYLVFQLLEPKLRGAAGIYTPTILLLVFVITTFVFTGAAVDVVSRNFHDKPASVGSAIGFALQRLLPLIWTVFILMLVFVGFSFLFTIPIAILPPLMFIMFPLMIVVFIMMYVWFAFMSQVVMVEKKSGPAALNRSKELTKGFRWRVFGMLFVVALVMLLITLGINFGLAAILPIYPPVRTKNIDFSKLDFNDLSSVTSTINYTNFVILTMVNFILSVFTSTYQSICSTLMYFDLRVRKEGYDLEVMASQTEA